MNFRRTPPLSGSFMKNNLAKNTSQSSSAEPQKKITVVQCPACQTKFAVDGNQLAAVEIPRFHCSRCDNVFTVDRVVLGLSRTPQAPEAVHIEATPTPVVQQQEIAKPALRDTAKSPTMIQDEYQFTFDFPQAEEPTIDSSPQSFDFNSADFREEEDALSMSGTDFGVSVMKDPFESDALSPVSDRDLESKLFAGISSGHESSSSHTSPFLQAPTPPTTLGDEPMGYAPFNRNTQRQATTDWSDTQYGEDLGVTANTIQRAPRARFLASLSPQWRGVLTITTPLLGFLLILGLFTAFCVSNPQGASAMAQSFFPGKEMAAPTDLYITDSKIKRINLESGETVSVVSGTIVNRTEESFNEVLVEGLLFDRSGNVLGRKKINAASSLGRSRIQSLSPEMIEDLQNAKPAKRFELKAGQIFEFTMAIPEEIAIQPTTPSFFSARIYSVKAKS